MGVYKQPKSKYWWYKFNWNGVPVRETTKQANKRVAEQMEAAHRTSLAKGEVGIGERKAAPTLHQFADNDFLPHVRSTMSKKPNTVRFYENSVENLKAYRKFADGSMEEITHDAIHGFILYRQSQKQSRRGGKALEISTINRDLATLRRMFNLAEEWGKVSTVLPKVKMLPGENQRERVLSAEEESSYLQAATILGQGRVSDYSGALAGIRATMRGEEPRKPDAFLLRDVITTLIDCGLRPDECFHLKPENIREGAVWIYTGKSKAARRRIKMTARVQALLEMRIAGTNPDEWLFRAETKSGHIESSSLAKQRAKVLETSGVAPFELYAARHTCLTRWAKWMDPFTLHRAAGHADMRTTLRYVHPSDDDMDEAVMKAREARGGHTSGHTEQTASSGAMAETRLIH